MRKHAPLSLLAITGFALAGCAPQASPEATEAPEPSATAEDTPAEVTTISATTTILGNVVEQVLSCVGDDGYGVNVLMPLGVDPHDYQPSSAQLATIAQSGVVVANGLALEESLVEPLEELEAGGGTVYRMAEMVDPIAYADLEEDGHDGHDDHSDEVKEEDGHDDHSDEVKEEDGHDDHDDHGHGQFDPHFWMDMERLALSTQMLGAELAVNYGADFERCGAEVATSIRDAEAQAIDILDSIPEGNRVLITDHEAMNYFAERYNFEIAGVLIQGGSTLAEPSSQELAALIDEIEARGLTTVFGNFHVPSDLLQAIAAESGGEVQVVPLYLGSIGEAGSEYASYQEMMLANARAIANALGS